MTSKKILGNERKQPGQKNHNYRDVNISKFPHRLQTRDPFSPYFPTLPRLVVFKMETMAEVLC